MAGRMTRVVVGGTFGFLHAGHKALIARAFSLGDYIYIGLTTDSYVRKIKPGERLPRYAARKRALDAFARGLGKRFEIRPLEDRFGPSTKEDFDVIVVTKETLPAAMEINRVRTGKGLKRIRIVRIRHVLAEDGKPISTTRIINREVDGNGNLL